MNFQASNLMNHQNQNCSQSSHLLTPVFTSDALLGLKVSGNEGQTIGNINEVIIDILTGKMCYAVISSKLDGKLIAAPWGAILYDVNHNLFLINMSVAKFELAPIFEVKNWPNMADERWADLIHSYFGIPMKHSNSLHSAM